MIEWIAQEAPELLEKLSFAIVERQPGLQRVQREYFKERFGAEIELVHYTDPRQMGGKEVFFVANEIFDSFPCDLVYKEKTALVEVGEELDSVEFDGDDEQVLSIADRYGQTKGEVARGYEAFAASLFDAAERIVFVSFDYGDKEVRNDFSIRIYKGHEVFPFFEEGVELRFRIGPSFGHGQPWAWPLASSSSVGSRTSTISISKSRSLPARAG